ncbi:hypothetical protein B5M09_008017 [Aphanomyces astaci]|uniref:Uncharacterized protein n=1 Tax=Aphanomyces astaci TaxID=112090 RepID=A0A3R7Y274_APHAT|nr:hypothetical protein B5M09_008017 [Aphanomyces astaci]
MSCRGPLGSESAGDFDYVNGVVMASQVPLGLNLPFAIKHRYLRDLQELAQLRQAKTDQGNNDDLEATDVTSTTTGDSNTPDDAKAHGSCGVIDMSSNNWFPEYSSNVESPHRSSIEAPREVNMTRKTRTTSTVDLSLSDPVVHAACRSLERLLCADIV